MKYFAYLRKSSEGERQQAQSLETQKRIVLEYASRNSLDVVDIIIESKSAADDGNRPEFTQMLKRFKKHETNGLIVAHVDRISRNLIESGIITKYFKAGYIKEIRTPDKNYSTMQDIMQLEMLGVFAAEYSRQLSIKVKEGQRTKFLRGEFNGKLLGYTNEKGSLIPNPLSAPLIQELFRLYSTGEYSLERLTDVIYKKGLRTSKGKKASCSVIHRILRNRAYMGIIHFNGEEHLGIHTPLVSQEVFETVQKRLDNKNLGREQTRHFVYRGYLTCAVCDCACTATRKKSRYSYYYCTNGKGMCDQHRKYLPEDRVEQLLYGLLTPFILREDLANISLGLYAQDLRHGNELGTMTHANLETELKSVDGKMGKLLDLLLTDKITQEAYDLKMKELSKLKADAQSQIQKTESIDPEITLELVKSFKMGLCNIAEIFHEGDDEVKEDLLKSVLWNSAIQDGKVTSVSYKLPYLYLKDLHKTDDISQWRR
ncbi:recombinase family protein [Candidatus Woesebacteria bacterium]|nr:recombinase family protein [Candidatus Woesebacteria bacterium]